MNEADPAVGPVAPGARNHWRTAVMVMIGGLMLLGTSCVGCLAWGRSVSVGGQAQARETFEAIAARWDADEVLKRAAPEFSTPRPQLERVLRWFDDRLGPVERCHTVEATQWNAGWTWGQGPRVVTRYSMKCVFEKAAADVSLLMVERSSAWSLLHLQVTGDALIGGPPASESS